MPVSSSIPVAYGQFLDAVIEGAIDSIIIIDAQGAIMRFNAAASKLLGYTADEVVGRNVNILMPEPHHSTHDGYIEKYLQTGVPGIIGIGREVIAVRKDGFRFPVWLAVSEVLLGEQRYFTGVLHDLSAIKAHEREIVALTHELEKKVHERTDELQVAVNRLLHSNKKLEYEISERRTAEVALQKSQQDLREALEKEKELSELKSRFVSTASHEFRTPLSTIQSSAALIGRYALTEQQEQREKHIARIKSSVSILNTILNDFLSLSKLEQGEVALKPEQIPIREFLNETFDEIEGLLKEGQELRSRDETDGLVIDTDKGVLKNILFNLLSNAIKYSGPGVIGCQTTSSDAHITISVTDQGMGIPLSEQKHLFERFFRAHNATNIQGTGLGLYIVSGYVKLLRGNISFRSEEGKGSTFTIILPFK
ncbi:MAG TPA: PAS domain-containing sensor histidine kinase [Saprospiraceae bacterium]|nr:PAS domain-containing sensor histidine kinase [Saprospiraceae bacterium]